MTVGLFGKMSTSNRAVVVLATATAAALSLSACGGAKIGDTTAGAAGAAGAAAKE